METFPGDGQMIFILSSIFLINLGFAKLDCKHDRRLWKGKNFEEIQLETFKLKVDCREFTLNELKQTKIQSAEDLMAIFSILMLICDKNCEPQNEVLLSFLNRACQLKSADACFVVEQLDYSHRKVQSWEYAHKHCLKGSAFACSLYGASLLDIDSKRAHKYLTMGCSKKSPSACKAL